jgi:hypothetical protein
LPLHIVVCGVLCKLKLIVGAYCVDVRWLLAQPVYMKGKECAEQFVSAVTVMGWLALLLSI